MSFVSLQSNACKYIFNFNLINQFSPTYLSKALQTARLKAGLNTDFYQLPLRRFWVAPEIYTNNQAATRDNTPH